MSPLARAADTAIRWYQRSISPRKGWSCAARVVTGGPSCSAAAREAVRTRGALGAVLPTLAQLALCYRAALMITPARLHGEGVCCCGPIPLPFRF